MKLSEMKITLHETGLVYLSQNVVLTSVGYKCALYNCMARSSVWGYLYNQKENTNSKKLTMYKLS